MEESTELCDSLNEVIVTSNCSNDESQKMEDLIQQPCLSRDPTEAQKYDDISEVSDYSEKSGDFDKMDEGGCPTDKDIEYSDPRPQPHLLYQEPPFVWMYHMEHPTDPPEYIPGFHLKLPEDYTFEFMFPNLFRRLFLPPPDIPEDFLFWTIRNPSVLQHLMRKMAITSLKMVVESLLQKKAVETLFWKVGLTAMFGSYDASALLRLAAYRLIEKDLECTFYLYIAAMIRIARKLETSKFKRKCKDKDFGQVNPRLIVVRKHSRMQRQIVKVKPKPVCSILKRTRSLVKRSLYIKKDCIRKLFKNTKENDGREEKEKKQLMSTYREEDIKAEDIASDLAYKLTYSDSGETSTDKNFDYYSLFHELDHSLTKKYDPAPEFEEDREECEEMCSKIIYFNFHEKSFHQNQEHSETCVGSLMNPDIMYFIKQVVGYVLKSYDRRLITKTDFGIPLECIDIETTKQTFHNLLSTSLNCWFRYTSREHPILELPLKYLDIDLSFLMKYMSKHAVNKQEKVLEFKNVQKIVS